MKKVVSVLVFIAILMCMLSSCSFQIRTIDELISPPKAPELKAGIRTALEEKIGMAYTLKAPSNGTNRAAFLLNDFDKDAIDEAIVFYQISGNQSTVQMALLKYADERWTVTQTVEGKGNDIYSVDFSDLDNNGTVEVIVGWESYNSKLKYGLAIYSYDNQSKEESFVATTQSLSFSAMTLADMNGDKKEELLLFSIDSSKTPAETTARLFSYTSNKLALLGSTALDNNVTAYTNIFVQQDTATQDVMVYIDGNKGESSMVTEVVLWDEASQTLKAPLSLRLNSEASSTLKGIRVHTRDFDHDMIAEIAGQEAMRSEVDTKHAALVHWSKLGSKYELKLAGFSLINFFDGYMIVLDEATVAKISVSYNEAQRSLTISEWDLSNNIMLGALCEIIAVPRNEWNENPPIGYNELLKNGDLVYAVKLLSSQEATLASVNKICENIEIYN